MTNLAKNILFVLAGIAAVLWLALVSPFIAVGAAMLGALMLVDVAMHGARGAR